MESIIWNEFTIEKAIYYKIHNLLSNRGLLHYFYSTPITRKVVSRKIK